MTASEALIAQARALHASHPEVARFCAFPDDLGPGPAQFFDHPVIPVFEAETDLGDSPWPGFVAAIRACARAAQWRETYKGTALFEQIMHRFGCYEIIGVDGFASSRQMRSFMVYMPPGFHYPMHEHPAEELYVVLAGEAEFTTRDGAAHKVRAGEAVFHPAMQPHATTTQDKPVLCYVLWHDEFDTAPVWSAT